MKANQLKIEFIKWLINKYKKQDIVIGNEVLFSIQECRADIVVFRNNKMYAYEIKSDSDNFINIENQVEQYLTTFDYTYIIITKKHLKQIENLSQFNIGIVLYNNKQFKVLKKALISKQILKKNIVSFLHYKELQLLYKLPVSNKIPIHTYRNIIEKKCSSKSIQKLAYQTLKERYLKLYKLFLNDISKDYIMVDDLKTLTGNISDTIH